MDEVVQGLWIGSLVSANDANGLRTANITTVISLGCRPDIPAETCHHVLYADLLDSAESVILHVFPETNNVIAKSIADGGNCLVHCVYGQSRSAAVCVAYLIFAGMSLENSLETLKICHPNICINPGFLGQLYLYARSSCFVEHQILAKSGVRLLQYPQMDLDGHDEANVPVLCRRCGSILTYDTHILQPRREYADLLTSFVHRHVDGFWKGYVPLHPPVDDLDTNEPHYVVQPACWIRDEVVKSHDCVGKRVCVVDSHCPAGASCLRCPGCEVECGFWKPNSIRLCAGYILCDLFALWSRAVLCESDCSALEKMRFCGTSSESSDGTLESHLCQKTNGFSKRKQKKREKRIRPS